MTHVWLVEQWFPDKAPDCQGIFSTKEKAIAACVLDTFRVKRWTGGCPSNRSSTPTSGTRFARLSLTMALRCEGCGQTAETLKADAGDNLLCAACLALPGTLPSAKPEEEAPCP